VTFLSTPTKYAVGTDVPAVETLRDSAGRVVDDAYVDAAVEEAIRQVRAAWPQPARRVAFSSA